MSLSIMMPCYVHIATSLSIVASQWMSQAMSLHIVESPQGDNNGRNNITRTGE